MQTIRSEPSILILGMGNDILTDDGIGPKLVSDLDRNRIPDGVTFKEGSLGGLELLETVKDHDEVIIIDAVKTGVNHPGKVFTFTPEDFETTLHLSNIHDIDFLTAIELGKRTGMKVPGKITIIAVEISEDRVFSSEFSEGIRKQYPEILRQVQDIVGTLLSCSRPRI